MNWTATGASHTRIAVPVVAAVGAQGPPVLGGAAEVGGDDVDNVFQFALVEPASTDGLDAVENTVNVAGDAAGEVRVA